MKNKLEDRIKQIGALAEREKMQVYAVGGYVRDRLLGRTTPEVDFVVVGDGPGLAVKAAAELKGHGLVQYRNFGTASFLLGDNKFEFVTARAESYLPNSRKPEVTSGTLEEDLRRRDFTINTLARPATKKGLGKIIDPFGGRKDVKQRRIRTPLEAASTFSDDPLRIMRAARFASQLNFEIDRPTREAMRRERNRLSIVSQERITDELLKILSHPKPSIGFKILQETGVLEIVFPELDKLAGVEQRLEHHHKDVLQHTLKVVDNLAAVTDSLLLRFAALVHDIGKPRVKRFEEVQGWTFHGHELVGERMLKHICRNLKLPKEYCGYSQKITRLHMRPIQLIGEEVTDSAVRRLLVQAGNQIEDLMMLCRADITSGNPKRVRRHLENFDCVANRLLEVEEKDRMRVFQSPVRGDEIMAVCGLEPGPLVGRLKSEIEEAILEGDIPNEHDAALKYLLSIKERIIGQEENR